MTRQRTGEKAVERPEKLRSLFIDIVHLPISGGIQGELNLLGANRVKCPQQRNAKIEASTRRPNPVNTPRIKQTH